MARGAGRARRSSAAAMSAQCCAGQVSEAGRRAGCQIGGQGRRSGLQLGAQQSGHSGPRAGG